MRRFVVRWPGRLPRPEQMICAPSRIAADTGLVRPGSAARFHIAGWCFLTVLAIGGTQPMPGGAGRNDVTRLNVV